MSVYTPVNRAQLESYLQQYNVGRLKEYRGIEAGVENSNFFVTTDQGEYVLTLVESVGKEQLPFILNFVEHLVLERIACARPIPLNSGDLFGELNQRPAVLMSRLNGTPLQSSSDQQANIIGLTLARMHNSATKLEPEQPIDLLQWCGALADRLLPRLEDDCRKVLMDNLHGADKIDWQALPCGPVHADLFPDNAMFEGDNLTGIIDFYHACSAPYLYDLCVTMNAWCYDERSGEYDYNKALILLDSYQSIRPLSDVEQKHFSAMLQVAAMRFWLSRLRDTHFQKEGEVVTRKDPAGKQQLLERLMENAPVSL